MKDTEGKHAAVRAKKSTVTAWKERIGLCRKQDRDFLGNEGLRRGWLWRIETKVRPMPQWQSSRYRHGTPSKEVYHAVGVPGWPTKEMKRSAFAGKGEFRIPVQTARSISEVQIPLVGTPPIFERLWDPWLRLYSHFQVLRYNNPLLRGPFCFKG